MTTTIIRSFELKIQDATATQIKDSLQEMQSRITKSDYLADKWNNLNRKDLEGFPIGQFKIIEVK